MALSMPNLRQASSGTLTTTRGTNSMNRAASKSSSKVEPASTVFSGTPNWSGVNNTRLSNYQGPTTQNRNPIFTSGLANLQYGDKNLQIPKALAQVLARESEVNGTRGGLSTLFRGQSPSPASPYSTDAVSMDQLSRLNADVAEKSKSAFNYGDALVQKQDLESQLIQAQAEMATPVAESGGPTSFQSTIQAQRLQRVKDLQDRISGLSPILNSKTNYQNSGRAPDELNPIRRLLDNWTPTVSNLPIKETVAM